MSAPSQASRPVRVLHLEDNEADHLLVCEMLRTDGLPCEMQLARNQPEFEQALQRDKFDVIISDFTLPSYDGLRALSLAEEWQKDVPFIFFSGTIGEETAVESLKTGAVDYIVKQRPHRLVAAVRRALQESAERARRKQAEQRIREQAALLDKAQDAIIVCNLADQVVFWNLSAQRIYGWSAEEAIGKRVHELHAEVLTSVLDEARQTLMKSGEWHGELNGRAKDGHSVIVRSSWSLVHDDEGRPASNLIISTDITEQKVLEERFLRAQRLESIGVLVGGIAHDLNNALAPVLMGVGLLENVQLPNGLAGVVETMKASAVRGSEMVQQILTFARGSGGKQSVIQSSRLVREMGKIISDTFPKSIVCRVQAGPEIWRVSGLAVQLHQVIMNLCVNARDAMPEGGTLVLAAENVVLDETAVANQPNAKPGRYLCLSVRDTGTGIPEQQIPDIFKPFFTTKAPGRGTGLGLSTSLTIVQKHGGFMSVASTIGRGTEFKVFLPAIENSGTETSPDNTMSLPAGKGEVILVVDDEAAILALAQSTLEAHGYKVLTAADGPSAIWTFSRQHTNIRLVIMDKSMPFMDGAATLTELRKINSNLKVVVTSGHDLSQQTDTSRLIRADGLIEKPFTVEQLVMTVHRTL